MTHRPSPPVQIEAFTLLELMMVIAIMILVTALIAPAITSRKNAVDITSAADTIKGVLEKARNYAMANNTYTYVGFYEEPTTASTPTNSTPAYPGKGRVVLAIVASTTGTNSCEDSNATSTNPINLIASQITPVDKLVKIEGVHMADIGAPPSPTPSPTPYPNSVASRPNAPYTYASPGLDYQNRISSDDTHTTYNHTMYPFTTRGYTFYKTLRFNPRGEASINATYQLRRTAEIGLLPARGGSVDTNSRNVIAVQFGGTGGNFKVYRQ